MAQAGAGLNHPKTAAAGIGNPQFLQHCLQTQQLGLSAGGPQAKPAEHQQPKARPPIALEQYPGAQAQGHEGQEAAAAIGHLDATALAAADLPHQSLEQQTAIKGEAGKQVEKGQG